MEYKGLEYELLPELQALHIHETNDGDEVERVQRASLYTELIGHAKPQNLIVDSKSTNAFLSPLFRSFLLGYIFRDVLEYGVKRVFFILSDEEFELAKSYANKPEFVTHTRSFAEVERILRDPANSQD